MHANNSVVGSLLAAICVLAWTPLAGQNPSDRPRLDLNISDGTYSYDYLVDGEKRRFVFTPSTRTSPSVTSVVTRRGEEFEYSFDVTNLDGAEQELYIFSVPVVASLVVKSEGWEEGSTTARRGRASWYKKRAPGAGRQGLRAGESRRFSVVSPMLPGPAEAEFRGNGGPIPPIPPEMPAVVRSQLEQVTARDFVTRTVISGVVPGMKDAPELTLHVFLARIEMMYGPAIARSKHPARDAILSSLRLALTLAADGKFPEARAEASRLARRVTSNLDPWSRELEDGLTVCLDYSAKVATVLP